MLMSYLSRLTFYIFILPEKFPSSLVADIQNQVLSLLTKCDTDEDFKFCLL